MVKKVLQKLITANNLEKSFVWNQEEDLPIKVSLVHDDTVVMFLNLDQRLFVTIPILKLA